MADVQLVDAFGCEASVPTRQPAVTVSASPGDDTAVQNATSIDAAKVGAEPRCPV